MERLGNTTEDRGTARQELLLAKERAIPPLLAALADPNKAAAHLDVVKVLAGLMTRIEDPRITTALLDHMGNNKSAAIRARIAYLMGLYQIEESNQQPMLRRWTAKSHPVDGGRRCCSLCR